MRAAHAFERAGVAAFHLEDQTFPKRCGHYADKSVVPVREMVGKLKAVRDALHDPDFVVIARTDAIAVEGFDAAIDRCHAYVEAGADVAFLDAPTSEAQIADIARRLPGWKLINMFQGGKTPLLPVSRLAGAGLPHRDHPERSAARRDQGDAAHARVRLRATAAAPM